MTTQELIETAFADVPYPEDENIAHHQDCLECDDIRNFFRGKSWRDLKFPELRGFQALSLFTPEAFIYFLPGYLITTLKDWSEADMIPYGIMRIGGCLDDTEKEKEEAREKRKKFSTKQREAVAAWLKELGQHGPIYLRGDNQIDYAIDQILHN